MQLHLRKVFMVFLIFSNFLFQIFLQTGGHKKVHHKQSHNPMLCVVKKHELKHVSKII